MDDWASVVLAVVAIGGIGLFAIRRMRRRTRNEDVSAPWAWELIVLPAVLSSRNVGVPLWAMTAGLMLIAGAAILRSGPERYRLAPAATALTALAGFWVWVRGPAPELIVSLAAALAIGCLVARRVGRTRAVTSVLDGVGLFLIVNVVAYYVFDLRSASAASRIGALDSTFGSGDRVVFPLVDNLNLAPAMAAVYFVAVPLLIRREAWPRLVFRLIALISAGVIFVASNGRLALVVGALIAALVLLAPELLRKLTPWAVLLSIVFVAIFPLLAGLIGFAYETVTAVAPELARDGGAESATSLAHRDIIWAAATEYWSTRVPLAERILGFGPQGQYVSGASSVYGVLLTGTTAFPQFASVHNSELQQLYDGGILGATLLAAGMLATALSATRGPASSAVYAASAAIVALAATSITEVTLAPGNLEVSFFVFLTLACALSASVTAEPGNAGLPRRPKGIRRLVVAR